MGKQKSQFKVLENFYGMNFAVGCELVFPPFFPNLVYLKTYVSCLFKRFLF